MVALSCIRLGRVTFSFLRRGCLNSWVQTGTDVEESLDGFLRLVELPLAPTPTPVTLREPGK